MVNVHIRIWESFFRLLEFENLFSVPILFHVKSEPISKSETVIEFITPPPTIPSRGTTPFPPRDQLQSRLVKEQECASEQPYRLNLHSQSVDRRLDQIFFFHYALHCSHSYEYFDRLSFDDLQFFGKRNAKALSPNIAIDCLALVV